MSTKQRSTKKRGAGKPTSVILKEGLSVMRLRQSISNLTSNEYVNYCIAVDKAYSSKSEN